MICFVVLNGVVSGGPYFLWSWIFSNRGVKILEARGLLMDNEQLNSLNNRESESSSYLNMKETTESFEQNLDLDIDKMSPKEAAEYLIAEQLGEKYTPVSEQNKTKIKYCSRCGTLIDPNTKKCTGCGKQYFKGVSAKALLCILISCVLIVSLVFNVVLYVKYDEKKVECEKYKVECDEYKDKPTYIVTNDNEEYLDYWSQNHNKVELVDASIVFIENDGSELYHKYECDKFLGDDWWAHNVEYAEYLGYESCPKCCK